MTNLNVLSQRYATPAINDIFSEEGKTVKERELWIAVMKAQKELGVDIPSGDIERFERAKGNVDLKRIQEIERETRHDVKAKIQGFVEIAGAGEHIHKGLTSRDLTDNVEQMQVRDASRIIFGKYVSVLRNLLDKSELYRNIVLTARTHHQPAQPTALGRRFSMWAEELLHNLKAFERVIETYPLRGIKGPVGTQADMLNLLGSDEKVAELEKRVADQLGFKKILDSPGQVYPRSLDLQVISGLSLLAAAPQNYANAMRLMAGYELVTEGFKDGQVGSSAMPHKMNTRSSERINGFAELLKMYVDGASRVSGDQWEEGDVSCSVVRRVVLPDAMYVSDGLCETTLTVLNEMGAYEAVIEKELARYAPFLATTALLIKAVQCGMGREETHAVIKKHAKALALEMRKTGAIEQGLAERLADDPEFPIQSVAQLTNIIDNASSEVGNAQQQISAVITKASPLLITYAKQAAYKPEEIL